MVLLRTSYICTGTSSNTILDYNLVRFGVCMIKLRHERMLILTLYDPGGGGFKSPSPLRFFALTHLVLELHYCVLVTFPEK